MANLPYVSAPGNVKKALERIIAAQTPKSVSQDFVMNILKIPGGSGRQMTSYIKKIGLAEPDGSPTELYNKFRNSSTRGHAAAELLKIGYAELYRKDEYMHKMDRNGLRGLVLEASGWSGKSKSTSNTVTCIEKLKEFANFSELSEPTLTSADHSEDAEDTLEQGGQLSLPRNSSNIGLNLGYTINLNLPATSDPAVFNAIFKSLRENLLRSERE